MRSTGPTILIGFVGVYLSAMADGAAMPMEEYDRAPAKIDERSAVPVPRSIRGDYDCGRPAVDDSDSLADATFDAGGRALVRLVTWQNDWPIMQIHWSVIDGIDGRQEILAASSAAPNRPFLTRPGTWITPKNDTVVAKFADNTGTQATGRERPAETNTIRFSGFKARLGRFAAPDADGGERAVDVIFRLIIDWGDQALEPTARPKHRAVYVISQVPVASSGEPPRELFYRFLPSGTPFRMLACRLIDASAI